MNDFNWERLQMKLSARLNITIVFPSQRGKDYKWRYLVFFIMDSNMCMHEWIIRTHCIGVVGYCLLKIKRELEREETKGIPNLLVPFKRDIKVSAP